MGFFSCKEQNIIRSHLDRIELSKSQLGGWNLTPEGAEVTWGLPSVLLCLWLSDHLHYCRLTSARSLFFVSELLLPQNPCFSAPLTAHSYSSTPWPSCSGSRMAFTSYSSCSLPFHVQGRQTEPDWPACFSDPPRQSVEAVYTLYWAGVPRPFPVWGRERLLGCFA